MVSEQGLADLRGKTPRQRAQLIIDKCVHPTYRDLLRDYVHRSERVSFGQHTPHDLEQALSWHIRLQQTGSMHPDHEAHKPLTSRDTSKAAERLDQTTII